MTKEELEVRKKMIEEFVRSKGYRAMSVKEMAMVLQVPAKEKKEFRGVLDELAAQGRIRMDLKGKIKPVSENVVTGKYMGTKRDFGFVRVEGLEEDIFIPAGKSRGAIDGDMVLVDIDERARGKRREGEVTTILERGVEMVVGTYSKSKSFGFVVPDNQKLGRDIYIEKMESMGAVTGHKVVVEITDYGDENRNPEGRIVEILGHINDPGVDILSVIKAYGLPEEYPDDVMRQVAKIDEEVSEADKQGRVDYRELLTVTIDGEDAKDLDDAVTLTKEGDMYHLGVHIADVSQYVTEGSALDREALKRGTSVYLVDRVIPMLPHKLSNGICSLNQGVDRLALSCMMEINAKGEIVRHRIEETVICVNRRMSYTSVNKIIEEKDEEEREKYQELIPMFELMYELAGILRERRFKRGSIDFDFPETKIIVDEKGHPLEVGEYQRNNAHRLIEEFMLAANQTVAEDYFWQELPFVYRVHEEPDNEKIATFNTFIHNFGYVLKVGGDEEIHPKEIQKLVNSVAGKPEEALISRLALRSMKQAKYTTSCEGHFGLAMKYYCHFTSPIRRYPDLQIHRIIKENLRGKMGEKRVEHYHQILPEVTAESSRLERRADDAEREVEKMKKAEYMEQFIGESFDGVISGVTTWGIYVELPNTVEGMVRVADIPGDYYYFEEEKYRMVGENTGKTYNLGETVTVTVAAVDKLTRSIDFVLNEEETQRESALPAGKEARRESILPAGKETQSESALPTEKRQSADGGEARSLEQLQRLAEQAFVKRVAGVKAKREEQENQINEQVKKLSNKARRKAKKKAKRVARRKEKSAQKSKAYRERRRGKE